MSTAHPPKDPAQASASPQTGVMQPERVAATSHTPVMQHYLCVTFFDSY